LSAPTRAALEQYTGAGSPLDQTPRERPVGLPLSFTPKATMAMGKTDSEELADAIFEIASPDSNLG
jgi:hypothetical protein